MKILEKLADTFGFALLVAFVWWLLTPVVRLLAEVLL